MIICKNCGFKNSDEMCFCGKCGAKLSKSADKIGETKVFDITDSDIVNNNSVKDSDFSDYGIKEKRRSEQRSTANHSSSDNSQKRPAGNSNTDTARKKSSKKRVKPNNNKYKAEKISTAKGDKFVIDYNNPTPEEKKRATYADLIFAGITVGILVISVLIGVLYVNRNFSGKSFKEKFNNMFCTDTAKAIITAKPTISQSETSDGEPAIIITVYAKNGTKVIFREGSTTMEQQISGSSIAFRVPISLWTSNKDIDLTKGIYIQPHVFVYDPARSNDIVSLDFEPYYVSLDTVNIVLTKPEAKKITTANSSVKIEGYVSDPTVTLLMNGEQLSMDEKGYFRAVYHIENYEKENLILFQALSPDMDNQVVGKSQLKITYDRASVNFIVNNTSLRTIEDTLKITGKTSPNTDVLISGVELDGDVNVNKSTGEFAFTVKLPNVGNYVITATLKAADSESSVDIYAEHAPDSDSYISTAKRLENYDYLTDHSTLDKHYGITGTVTEVYQNEPYVKAKLHTAEGDLIFIYFDSEQTIEEKDGKSYRIYASLDGIDSETGLPLLYCWFIYKS